MPARIEEIKRAEQEGVHLGLLTSPVVFLGENWRVQELGWLCNDLGEPDSSGRCKPTPVEGSNF
jgi:NADPH-dependent glutamate synthase beta subunit-like oxidoreductase